MQLLWCLAFLVISVSSKAIDNDSEKEQKKDRIVGGRAAKIETLPYQAQLLQNGHQICGATIISKSWLVTASHCISESSPKWSIITGSDKVSSGGEHHEIKQVIMHPEYNRTTTDNDIALIELVKPLMYNQRQKAIPLATRVPQTGEKMTVSGFGKLGEDASYAIELQVVDVPIIDHEKCQANYLPDVVTNNMFCAGAGPTDSCQGDSGGPGVINGELVGVVSSGMKCASKFYPGLYATVYNYIDWINKTTKKNRISRERKFKIPIISDVFDLVLKNFETIRS